MPEMSGLEFLRAAREAGNMVTFGFVTSETGADYRENAILAGAAFVLAKPFTADLLHDAIGALA